MSGNNHMETVSNYLKYRGKCKEMCEELVANNSSLRLVRGYYYEAYWSREEPHWWCVDTDGNIIDPTKLQFPSGGIAEFYREFDGRVECEQCGKSISEEEMIPMGNYPVCSSLCGLRLVGCA